MKKNSWDDQIETGAARQAVCGDREVTAITTEIGCRKMSCRRFTTSSFPRSSRYWNWRAR